MQDVKEDRMNNLRRKRSSWRYKKRTGNQYTTAKAVTRHIIDEIDLVERNNKNKLIILPKKLWLFVIIILIGLLKA